MSELLAYWRCKFWKLCGDLFYALSKPIYSAIMRSYDNHSTACDRHKEICDKLKSKP